ncbi:MAG: arginase family protein, partial [Myxococcota bacterium]|nr:arginase family protein [Myxococcota bacterium]
MSTGLAEQRALQRKIYQLEADEKDEQIEEAWLEAIRKTYSGEASGFILGVPSDTGAGFRRGANLAPAALRERRLSAWPRHALSAPCFADVGDIRVIPHLLSEEMISSEQRRRAREALYEDPTAPFPVTPLGICQSALRHLIGPESDAIPIVLGGDHSISWPAFLAAFQRWERSAGERVGILHFDAHTDLLPDRLGVKYCFATWAYHANELLGRDGRLVQLGIRASGRDQAHWESTLGVHQIWADALRSQEDSGIEVIADQLIDHF